MDSVRAALMLLQEHMLFIDHYVPITKGQRWSDIPNLSNAPILKHIDNYRRSFELQSGTSAMIEQATLQLLRYKGVLPTPSVPFLELVHIFANHISVIGAGSHVSGKYIIQALCFFFRCDKIEAFIRYVGPLVQYKVIRNASPLRPSPRSSPSLKISVQEIMRVFEESTYTASALTSLPPRLAMSHVLPRLTSILCFDSGREGESELMFLSHNLMTFARIGENVVLNPIGLGPSLLRRCWIGSSWFFGQKSLSPQSETPFSTDTCAIISNDDYHLAVVDLCSTNNPGNIPLRKWAPVFVVLGFPVHLHPNTIQSGVKQLLDALEMRYGPREQLPYQASGGDAIAFRELCHSMGKTIFDLTTAIFYQSGNSQAEIVPRTLLSGAHTPLNPMNGSYLGGVPLSTGFQRKIGGLPQLMSDFTGFLCPHFSLHAMSPKTLASASRMLLLATQYAQAAAQAQLIEYNHLGQPIPVNTSSSSLVSNSLTRLACAIYYNGNLVFTDTHPYIARLLWLATFSWQNNNARSVLEASNASHAAEASASGGSGVPTRVTNLSATGTFTTCSTVGGLASISSSAKKGGAPHRVNVPLSAPLNYLHPKGPFAEHTLKPKPHFFVKPGAPLPAASTSPSSSASNFGPSTYYAFSGPLQGSGAMRYCSMIEAYLTFQDTVLLWRSSRGTSAQHAMNNTHPFGLNDQQQQSPRPAAPAPEGWHPSVHLSHNGIEIIMLFQSDTISNCATSGTRSPKPQQQGGGGMTMDGMGVNSSHAFPQSLRASTGLSSSLPNSASPTDGKSGGASPTGHSSTGYGGLLGGGGKSGGGEPLQPTITPTPVPESSIVRSKLFASLPMFAGSIVEEMQVLRHSIAKNDIVKKPKPIPTTSGGGTSKQRKLPDTVGYVHSKGTGTSTFLEGNVGIVSSSSPSGIASGATSIITGGSNNDNAISQLNVLGEGPVDSFTAANLQRSCQLVSEASAIAKLLGTRMHNQPQSYYTQSLASKPITRVILGRSAFGDYGDKPGTFNVLYGKETAGQQCVVGTASSVVGATLRNAEDQYLMFAGACAKNNISIV